MAGGTKKEPGALTKEIAAILRERVGRLKTNKEALAKEVGISRPQLSKILLGQKQIDIELLEDICIQLDLNWIEVIRKAEGTISEARSSA